MSEEKRYTPSVSLKESERDWIKNQADKHGISYTNYMRKVVLGQIPPAEKTFRKEDQKMRLKSGISQADIEKLLDYNLAKAGTNLNQIARRLNEGDPLDQKMIDMMDEVKQNFSHFTTEMSKALR